MGLDLLLSSRAPPSPESGNLQFFSFFYRLLCHIPLFFLQQVLPSSSHKGRLVWVFLTGQIEVSLLPLLVGQRDGGREEGVRDAGREGGEMDRDRDARRQKDREGEENMQG